MKESDKASRAEGAITDRRSVLKLLGIGSVGGAALAVTGEPAAAAAETTVESKGYRETEHVRRYYELAR